MIDFTQAETIERLADLVAERVAQKLQAKQTQVLVSREELAALTGIGKRTIDRMAKGGSMEIDKRTGQRVWRESTVKLEPIRNGRKVLFDKAVALAAIKGGLGG